jgi:hypothetical protein
MSHLYVVSVTFLYFVPSPVLDNSKKQVKLLHCNVPLLLSTPDCNHSLLQVVELSATMERARSVDPDKLKKVIRTLINLPDLKVLQAMLLKRFSDKEVVNLSLRHFIWLSLTGKMVKSSKTHVSGSLLPPLPQPDHSEQLCNCIINDNTVCIEEGSCATGVGACERVIAVMPSPLPALLLALPRPQGRPPSLVSASTAAVKKQKSWDRAYYLTA